MKEKVGILSHGYHCGAPDWMEIVWGRPPFALGRAPKAVQIAAREKAELIVFGTGASEKYGLKEAEYTIIFLLENFDELKEFSAFRRMNLVSLRDKIARISVPETISQNTAEEVAFAGRIFAAKGVERVYQVSSPFHIPRCHRDALVAFRADPKLRFLLRGLAAVASETGPNPAETIILEPSSRPDDKTGEWRMKIAPLLFQPDKLAEIAKTLGL